MTLIDDGKLDTWNILKFEIYSAFFVQLPTLSFSFPSLLPMNDQDTT